MGLEGLARFLAAHHDERDDQPFSSDDELSITQTRKVSARSKWRVQPKRVSDLDFVSDRSFFHDGTSESSSDSVARGTFTARREGPLQVWSQGVEGFQPGEIIHEGYQTRSYRHSPNIELVSPTYIHQMNLPHRKQRIREHQSNDSSLACDEEYGAHLCDGAIDVIPCFSHLDEQELVARDVPRSDDDPEFSGDSEGRKKYLEDDEIPPSIRKINEKYKKKHLRLFGHGRLWTIAAFVLSWIGVVCSILSCRSTSFVRLSEPILINSLFAPVEETGMFRFRMCLNGTVTGEFGCENIRLEPDRVDDRMFELGKIFLILGTVFGTFFTLCLSNAVYWESIQLRPIGLGYLFSYFLQSFSMLFFDSDVCRTNKCRVSTGCCLCIVACIAWIGTCISAARMEAHKLRANRKRRRERRRAVREEQKRLEAEKEQDSTAPTDSTASSH